MVRAIARDDRNEAGNLSAIDRPRLRERIRASASYPIALLIAPAGYGKSVVLRQFLESQPEECVRFGLRAEHGELLGFLRGFAEAMRAAAPHAITALAGAYERAGASPRRAGELARWMNAHMEAYSGIVAIDDLHLADDDPEVAEFLTALIEQTKRRVRWILASRSTAGLPVGTWLAYGDAEAAVDENALRFTATEVRAAANALGLAIRDEELDDLLALTEGWPAAMAFALRTSMRSAELRNVSAMTREMIYRLLAEQVYAALDADERDVLEIAIALPVIDVAVLERAGFDRALPIVERLRERTAFIYEESPGIYQCHDLFRDFLRHQSALGGKRSHRAVHERAARALEESGDVEHALSSYTDAGASSDVVRLLEQHGFDLLERARGDVVARAVDALDERTRRENATVLALQGSLQAIAGKFARAESLLRRALTRAGSDRDLVATTSLRLASLIGNQGRDVSEILDAVAGDSRQKPAHRAEALSLVAARCAIAGDLSKTKTIAPTIEQLLPQIDSEATRAKVLHYLGIVSRHLGDVRRARERLEQSGELAAELHLFGLESRVYAVLSNLALHEDDDVVRQLQYAEHAADAAGKAGDAFALRTALLQTLSAQMRRGAEQESVAVEARLGSEQSDPLVRQYLTLFRSMRLAWDGQFGEAHRRAAGHWRQLADEVDRLTCGSQYALFLALDGLRDSAVAIIGDMLDDLGALDIHGRFDLRSITIATLFCALAEFANGRNTQAERILRRVRPQDRVQLLVWRTTKNMMQELRRYNTAHCDEITKDIAALDQLEYGDTARLLRATYSELSKRSYKTAKHIMLTPAECEVLRMLAAGLAPKEVAIETSRSVNTVRVHIAKLMDKLECHGRLEAIQTARKLGLI